MIKFKDFVKNYEHWETFLGPSMKSAIALCLLDTENKGLTLEELNKKQERL